MPGRFNLEEYVPVQDRINTFWQDHPEGRILTAHVSDPADWERCRYRAEVYRTADDEQPASTGYAFEVAGGRGANESSHEENCETSAIGRALANLGYATSSKDRPSREEMGKSERQPERPTNRPASNGSAKPIPATEKQVNFIYQLGRNAGIGEGAFAGAIEQEYGVEPEQLDKATASAIIERLNSGWVPTPKGQTPLAGIEQPAPNDDRIDISRTIHAPTGTPAKQPMTDDQVNQLRARANTFLVNWLDVEGYCKRMYGGRLPYQLTFEEGKNVATWIKNNRKDQQQQQDAGGPQQTAMEPDTAHVTEADSEWINMPEDVE